MRQIKLDLLVSNEINNIGGTSRLKVEKSNNFQSLLIALFPEREGYWRIANYKNLKISFFPHAPFGADPEILADFLFDDFESDLEFLIEELGLDEVSISGISSTGRKKIDRVFYSNKQMRKELKISAYEVKKVIDVLRSGETTDDILLSVLLNKDQVYTYIIPNKINFSFLFSSIDELKDYHIDEFCDSVCGCSISSETVIAQSIIRYISPKEWRVKKPSRALFAYPYFNKNLKMERMVESDQEACCNCLTCAAICTAGLYPSFLYHHLDKENLSDAKSIGLLNCSLCRKCSLVCPSNLHLSKRINEGMIEIKGGMQ